MKLWRRWLAFNLVGIIGVFVQLVTLSIFRRLLHGHYLAATAAALEATLLHNFVWHTRYTWRGQCTRLSRMQQVLRFHLSNGLLSLVGNLLLMRLMVGAAHLPVLLSNAIAILCCSLANFWLTNRWTFVA